MKRGPLADYAGQGGGRQAAAKARILFSGRSPRRRRPAHTVGFIGVPVVVGVSEASSALEYVRLRWLRLAFTLKKPPGPLFLQFANNKISFPHGQLLHGNFVFETFATQYPNECCVLRNIFRNFVALTPIGSATY